MSASIKMTGDAALVRALDAIVAEDGAKSLNKSMRKATRAVCKEIILPASKALVNVDSGDLEAALVVRALKGKRGKLGHSVGFKDGLFKGDTFYGGFLEFGFKDRGGGRVPPDSFLRRPLYENDTLSDVVVKGDARDEAAKLAGVSARTISDAKYVKRAM